MVDTEHQRISLYIINSQQDLGNAYSCLIYLDHQLAEVNMEI